RVDDREVPWQIRTIGRRRQPMSDRIDQPIELRLLVVNAELTYDLLMRFLPDLNLLALGDQAEFAFVRDRVGGTGGEEEEGGEESASHGDGTVQMHCLRSAAACRRLEGGAKAPHSEGTYARSNPASHIP